MRKPADEEANERIFRLDPESGRMAVAVGEAAWTIAEVSRR